MIKILLHTSWLWYCGVYSQNSEIYINIWKLCKTNITGNVTCFPRTWRHKTFHFTVLFQTATFEMQRNLFSAYVTSFSAYHFPVLFHTKNKFRSRDWRHFRLCVTSGHETDVTSVYNVTSGYDVTSGSTEQQQQQQYSQSNDEELVKCINIFQPGSRLVRQFIFNLQLL
jgi:hypothetical protein